MPGTSPSGPGLLDKTGKRPATPQEIAELFRIDRPLISSKVFRKPQRGALGNGLRVVAGCVIASRGKLVVTTHKQRLTITPLAEGGATVVAKPAPASSSFGTRIEISFGPDMPEDDDALLWAEQSIEMAGEAGPSYSGKTSAWWFDADAFYALVHDSGDRPVRDLIERHFDGCSGAKAGEIASRFLQRSCEELTRNETTQLLLRTREMTLPVSFDRLGAVGKSPAWGSYARQDATIELGIKPKAQAPFIIEAWAENIVGVDSEITIYVNRTPVTGNPRVYLDNEDNTFTLFGCGLYRIIPVPTKKKAWRLVLNVTAPLVPITTDGKEPNLKPIEGKIIDALSEVIAKAHRAAPKTPKADSYLPGEKDLVGMQRFADKLKQIVENLNFKPSSRGCCYLLEDDGLKKGDFNTCQRRINRCRKNGMLPYDFCSEDERRSAEGVEEINHENPDDEAEDALTRMLHWHEQYRPFSFWDTGDTYVEMAVEKVDLKELFRDVCAEHHVTITNRAGWSDINSRCAMMLRFKEQEERGKRCVLLYCGDFDPGGLNISNFIRSNFEELSEAVGWSPDNLIIERFGLNYDFIQAQGLTWIDNLETAGGKYPLDDPRHPDHEKDYVQNYLKRYCKKDAQGKWEGRKVEANALVKRPEAGRLSISAEI